MRRRKLVVIVVLVWMITRGVLAWTTLNDDRGIYRDRAPAAHDITLYDYWAQSVDAGQRPYVDFALEYPPANLPFLLVPRTLATLTGQGYGGTFVAMAVVIDGFALGGLVVLAWRNGSWAGPMVWLALIPLLGPVALSRLDVIPAAAIVWAVVLARERRWGLAGALVGVATGTKVFAGLLVPLWLVMSRARVRFLVGVGVAGAVPLALFLDIPDRLIDNIWEYHSGRGIAVESSWGSLLLVGRHLAGEPPRIELRSGAWEIVGLDTGILKAAATLAVLAVAAHATRTAARLRHEADVGRLTALTASTVVLSVGVGNVLSPQYLVWCIGAAAAAAALRRLGWVPLSLLAAASVGSHLVFPILFWDITFYNDAAGAAVLVARNALLIGAGFFMLRAATRPDRPPVQEGDSGVDDDVRSDPGIEQDEAVPVLGGDR